MKKKILIGAIFIALIIIGFVLVKKLSNRSYSFQSLGTEQTVNAAPPNVSESEAQKGYILNLNGETYSVINGCDIYQKNGDEWKLIDQICYDPSYKDRYSEMNGNLFLRIDDGREVLIPKSFSYDFESTKSIKDLFITDVGQIGFTAMTLQSPKAPEVADYVNLRNCIVAGTCDFLDNRIDIEKNIVHRGSQSLKFTAVAPNKKIETSKASIETQLIDFRKGDDVWFEGWYYFEKGIPSGIMDLESSWLVSYPGPRIWVNPDRALEIELKALDKPRYKQTGTPTPLPENKWVRIVLHYKLSDTSNGIIELWQDNKKIIDARGKNIPFPDIVLSLLEVGISANSTKDEIIMYVDDISIGKTPPQGY